MRLHPARPLLLLIFTFTSTHAIAQTTQEPASHQKPLLITGASLTGAGIGLMAAGFGETCSIRASNPPVVYYQSCPTRSEGMGWSGLMLATAGEVVLTKAGMNGASKNQLRGAGATMVLGGIGMMALGFGPAKDNVSGVLGVSGAMNIILGSVL